MRNRCWQILLMLVLMTSLLACKTTPTSGQSDDLPTLAEIAPGASLRDPDQNSSRSSSDAQRSKPPYRVNIQQMYYPLREPRLALWLDELDPPKISPRTLAALQANGFGIGEVDRASLRMFLANLDEPYRIRLSTLPMTQHFTPLTLTRVDRRPQLVEIVDRDGERTQERLSIGHYQFLMKLVPPDQVLSEGQTPVLDLIAHHQPPNSPLIPIDPTNLLASGRAFDMLHIVETIPDQKAWVIWAEVSENDDPRNIEDALPLGRAMLHGFYQTQPAQMIVLLVPTTPLTTPEITTPPTPTTPTTPTEPDPDESEPVELIEVVETPVILPEPTAEPEPAPSSVTVIEQPISVVRVEVEPEPSTTEVPVSTINEPDISEDDVTVEPVEIETVEVVPPATSTPSPAVTTLTPEAPQPTTTTEVVEIDVNLPPPTPTARPVTSDPSGPASVTVTSPPARPDTADPETPSSPAPQITDDLPIDPFSGTTRLGNIRIRTAD